MVTVRQFAVAGNIGLGTSRHMEQTSALNTVAADPTIRSVQRFDAIQALVDAGNLQYQRSCANLGSTDCGEWRFQILRKLRQQASADAVDFYGHANYASKRVEGGFYFRSPNTRSGVSSALTSGADVATSGICEICLPRRRIGKPERWIGKPKLRQQWRPERRFPN